jgi:RNA polymerase sigma-70 factor, ECF subfamily
MEKTGTSVDVLKKFNEAYNNCYSVLFGSVYARIGSFDEAEDILQELFIIMYRKIETISNPRAWLYGALRLVMFDYYRAKGKYDKEIEAMVDDASMAYVNGFREARMVIQEVLDSEELFLTETNRSVFELVAMQDYSFADVARDLGLTYRQVQYAFKTTSARIIAALKSKGISKLEDLL